MNRQSCIKRGSLAVTAMLAATLGPTTAYGQSFGSTNVQGIRIDQGKNPPRTLLELPGLLSSASICAEVQRTKPTANMVTDHIVATLNAIVRRRVGDVQLVRYRLEYSPACASTTSANAIADPNSPLILTVKMPGNSFVSSVTTPSTDVLGVEIGAGRTFDPRLSIRFDVELTLRVPIPRRAGGQFGPVSGTVRLDNVQMPEGENITGDVVAFGADVTRDIYDWFNNGELARTMQQGWRLSESIPPFDIDRMNAAARAGAGTQVDVDVAPGDQLVINFNMGEKLVDERCQDTFVWREAVPGDRVCVTPGVRAAVRADNSVAHQRRLHAPRPNAACLAGGPCRPDFRIPCIAGFVWREAVPSDYVCVTPAVRTQAKDDNSWSRRRRRDYESPVN
jgi:hypothetical protein